jgi:TonB family protein
MILFRQITGAAFVLGILMVCRGLCAQETSSAPKAQVVLTNLAPPVYPPIAKQARISGDVELSIEVQQNGSVASATLIKGHPLLAQAAIDSAKHSKFDCRNCPGNGPTSRLLYSFELGPTSYCAQNSKPSNQRVEEQPYPRISQVDAHITIVDRPVGTCDMPGVVGDAKVRSLKCLYLWKCGKPRVIFVE